MNSHVNSFITLFCVDLWTAAPPDFILSPLTYLISKASPPASALRAAALVITGDLADHTNLNHTDVCCRGFWEWKVFHIQRSFCCRCLTNLWVSIFPAAPRGLCFTSTPPQHSAAFSLFKALKKC